MKRAKLEIVSAEPLLASIENARVRDNPGTAFLYWHCLFDCDETFDGGPSNVGAIECHFQMEKIT